MNELALFAGTGNGLYGSLLCGFTTVCAVEVNPKCRAVLLQRQRDGVFPMFPIWDDVCTFDGRPLRGWVDVVTGGDPCQENSAAFTHGKCRVPSLGAEFLRVVGEVRPSYVMRENPARVRKEAPWPADRFAEGLESLGYATAIVEIRACCLGADHQRGRMWVLGRLENADSQRWDGGASEESAGQAPRVIDIARPVARKDDVSDTVVRADVADADSEQLEVGQAQRRNRCEEYETVTRDVLASQWRKTVADELCRGPDGGAGRRFRLQALGEGQVPVMVRAAWELLAGAD